MDISTTVINAIFMEITDIKTLGTRGIISSILPHTKYNSPTLNEDIFGKWEIGKRRAVWAINLISYVRR